MRKSILTIADGEFSEIDYYLFYSLPVTNLDVSIGYTAYTYPNGGSADHEIGLSIGKGLGDSGFYPYCNIYYALDGSIDNSWYLQAGFDYGIDVTEALSVSAGIAAAYVVVDGGADGFTDGTATLGASYVITSNLSVGASVNYVTQFDSDVLPDGKGAYDTDFYGVVGATLCFP